MNGVQARAAARLTVYMLHMLDKASPLKQSQYIPRNRHPLGKTTAGQPRDRVHTMTQPLRMLSRGAASSEDK
jgi:hypothetical protein